MALCTNFAAGPNLPATLHLCLAAGLLLLATAARPAWALEDIPFPGGNFATAGPDGRLPTGWTATNGQECFSLIKEGDTSILRIDSKQLGYLMPNCVVKVSPEWSQIAVSLRVRLPAITLAEGQRSGFALRAVIKDTAGKQLFLTESTWLSKVDPAWTNLQVTATVPPGATELVLSPGFFMACGTVDLADCRLQAEVRPTFKDGVPAFTVRDGLPNVVRKLQAGGEVRIAYLGGSITAQNGWRVQTFAWFGEQYPTAKLSEINAAVGGTGSDFGAYRVGYDVLTKKPDLVFIEFAVNDSSIDPTRIKLTMEGLVRQIWQANPLTDICFVYTAMHGHGKFMLDDLAKGQYPRAAGAHEAVAAHYGIPSIHMGVEVARLFAQGRLKVADNASSEVRRKAMAEGMWYFAGDGVHPFEDTGHPLYTRAVVAAMHDILPAGTAGAHALPKPMSADNWEDARMVPLDEAFVQTGPWRTIPAGDPFLKQVGVKYPTYLAGSPGATLTFTVKARSVGVLDLKSVSSGRLSVAVDGQQSVTKDLFSHVLANTEAGRVGMQPLADGLDPTRATSIALTCVEFPAAEKRASIAKDRAEEQKAILALDDTAFAQRYGVSEFYPVMLLIRGTVLP